MAMKIAEKQRINVTFPVDLLAELNRLVPPRQRNRFIVEATEQALRRTRLDQVLAELRREPAWKDQDHPDLLTVSDVNRYVRRFRQAWTPRSWEEILAEAKGGR